MTGIEVLALGASLAGTAFSAMGQIQAGNQANQAAKYNAQVLENQARQTVLNANTDASLRKRQLMKERGSAVAAYGASGVQIDSGTPFAVLSDLATEAELDAALTRFQGTQEAKGLNSQAAMSRYEGKVAKRNGMTGAMGTLLGGASSLAGGGFGGGSKTSNIQYTSPGRATSHSPTRIGGY
jgi:hypothetical protein